MSETKPLGLCAESGSPRCSKLLTAQWRRAPVRPGPAACPSPASSPSTLCLPEFATRHGYSEHVRRFGDLHDCVDGRDDFRDGAICSRVLSRIDVLVIDDWAMAPLSEPERRISGRFARTVIK